MKKGIALLSTVLFLLSFIAYADVGEVEDAGDAVKDEAAAPAAEAEAAVEKPAEEAAPAEAEKPAEEAKTEEAAPAAKEEAKAEEPKAEEAAEAPKAEEVKVEEVKVEEAAAEKPAAEEKKVEEPKPEVAAEAPKVEEKVAEKPAEEVKVEEAKPVEVVAEAPKVEEAKPAEEAKPVPAEAPKKQEAAAAPEEKKAAEECGECPMTSIGMALLYYIPNRILDLNDSITMDIGVGSESGVEFGITKYFQFGGMYGDKYFLMKGYNGQYGGAYSGGWNGELLKPGWNYSMACLADESRVIDDSFGTIKKYIKRKGGLGMCDISQEAYKKGARDFWEMDVKAGWLVTFGLQIHPVDMADFLCGLFLIDFKGNDLK